MSYEEERVIDAARQLVEFLQRGYLDYPSEEVEERQRFFTGVLVDAVQDLKNAEISKAVEEI